MEDALKPNIGKRIIKDSYSGMNEEGKFPHISFVKYAKTLSFSANLLTPVNIALPPILNRFPLTHLAMRKYP